MAVQRPRTTRKSPDIKVEIYVRTVSAAVEVIPGKIKLVKRALVTGIAKELVRLHTRLWRISSMRSETVARREGNVALQPSL